MYKKKNLKHTTYNDGVIHYGKVTSEYNSAQKKTGETFNAEGTLFFEQMTSRESDNMTANAMGYRIDMKIKVPLCKKLNNSYKVELNGLTFDIVKADNDFSNTYLYLQKVGV